MEDETTGKSSRSKSDELEKRLIDFAVRIIKLSARLPKRLRVTTSLRRFCDLELLPPRITARPEAAKATPISFIRLVSF